MRIDTIKERGIFISELRSTGRPDIEILIRCLEENHFFQARSHSHDNWPGGTVHHSLLTLKIARNMRAKDSAKHPNVIQRVPDDSLTLCCLLHDVCNMRGKADLAARKHGYRSRRILETSGFKFSDEEIAAVRFHMGRPKHELSGRDKQLFQYYKGSLRYYVDHADKIAARNSYRSVY